MSFSFHEGLPKGLTPDVDQGIFHNPDHLKLQDSTGWRTFYIQQSNTVQALVHFHIKEQRALSPYRSPFGSFLISSAVDENTLTEFVSYCETQLMKSKVNSVFLKNPPQVYSPEKSELLSNVFHTLGYTIANEETSAVIVITDHTFEYNLHKSEKKKLRKCRDNELRFEIILLEQLQKIYTFLEACRLEKGYSLSMSFPEIKKLAETFPQRIILTSVTDKNQLAAANISIRISEHVLYNFYHDHASEYDHVSPVVLLNEGLYQYSQQNKIELLDLGTSNIDGKVNESLLNFKVNLGAKPSRKLTFTKNLV